MDKNFVIIKCNSCGAVVKVLKDCDSENCNVNCCGKEMKALEPNSVDAALEKHIPTYEVNGDKIIVKVNHVMDENHFIEWICMVHDNRECLVKFSPGQTAEASFHYKPGAILYSYCNLHGLWKTEVK